LFKNTINMPQTLKVKIDEHKAPTDDSIRLYEEYREKAIKSIIDINTESLSVDKIQWIIRDAPEIYGIYIDLVFFVDEKKCEETIKISKRDMHGNAEKQCEIITNYVYDCVVASVSREITYKLFNSMGTKISNAIIRK
jgi:hypothetical protein